MAASKEFLRNLRKKHGLGEFRKKKPSTSRRRFKKINFSKRVLEKKHNRGVSMARRGRFRRGRGRSGAGSLSLVDAAIGGVIAGFATPSIDNFGAGLGTNGASIARGAAGFLAMKQSNKMLKATGVVLLGSAASRFASGLTGGAGAGAGADAGADGI